MRLTQNYTLAIIFINLFVFSSCMQNEKTESDFTVDHKGVLREIMMMGELHARADLMEYVQKPNLVALGAIEGLAGEILIDDGEALISKVIEGQLTLEKGLNHKAALLVSSEVKAWESIITTTEVNSMEGLQTFIQSQLNLSPERPFPFKIKGTVKSLKWHIINGPGATAKNHDAYKEAGLEGLIEDQPVEILGFYSEQHEGVFTHHGSYLHMHFTNEQKSLMGHVDDIAWKGEIELITPKSIAQ